MLDAGDHSNGRSAPKADRLTAPAGTSGVPTPDSRRREDKDGDWL